VIHDAPHGLPSPIHAILSGLYSTHKTRGESHREISGWAVFDSIVQGKAVGNFDQLISEWDCGSTGRQSDIIGRGFITGHQSLEVD
jgi:hypothetical protein